MTRSNRNRCMDTIKGFACIFVVLIHYNWGGDISNMVKTVGRFAVPFFFFISGYFLPDREGNITAPTVSRKLKHTLNLLGKVAAFYAVFCIFWNTAINPSWDLWEYTRTQLAPGRILKSLLTGDVYVYAHLWYMAASVGCYLVLRLLLDRPGKTGYCLLFAATLVIYFLFAEFSEFVGFKNFCKIPGGVGLTVSNLFVLRALPSFLLGILLRKFRVAQGKKLPFLLLLAGALLGCLLAILEERRFDTVLIYTGTYLCVVCLALMSIWYPEKHLPVMETIGSKYSMHIYLFHITAGKLMDLAAAKLHLWGKPWYEAAKPLIVLAGSLLIAFLLTWLQSRPKKGAAPRRLPEVSGIHTQMNLMSAMAILLVVCGHEACGALNLSNLFPYYSFHLPVFVFISGYFYSTKAEEKPLRYLWRNAKKLLGYFFFWQFSYAALLAFLNVLAHGRFTMQPKFTFRAIFLSPILESTGGLTTANWYLVMLFFLLGANLLIRKLLSLSGLNQEWFVLLISLVGGYLGITMAKAGWNEGIWLRITQVLFFLPFLSLGRLYKLSLEPYVNAIPSWLYFGAVFLIQGLLQYWHFEAVSAHMASFQHNPLVYYAYGINGIALLLRISRILDPAIGSNPAVLYLGRNTRTVMAHHMPAYFGIRFVFWRLMPYFSVLASFEVQKFTSSVYYHYYPYGGNRMSVLYVIATTAIPLLLLKAGQCLRQRLFRKKAVHES